MTGGDQFPPREAGCLQLDLNLALNRKRPGDTITLEIYRGQQKMVIKVTLGEA